MTKETIVPFDFSTVSQMGERKRGLKVFSKTGETYFRSKRKTLNHAMGLNPTPIRG